MGKNTIISLIGFICILLSFSICSCRDKAANPELPEINTRNVSDITQVSAKSGGNISSDGGFSITSRGICLNISGSPTISDYLTSDGTGTGSFASSLTELTPGSKYYVRAYATNKVGTSYGNEISFSTAALASNLPTVTTNLVSEVALTTAVCGGNVTSDGGLNITSRGICWSAGFEPKITDYKTTDGNGSGPFTSNLTGLSSHTIYYARAYATSAAGTGYGDLISFSTLNEFHELVFNPSLSYSTLVDIDGNSYKTIQIGNQIWMAENLKTTTFNDGSTIPKVSDNVSWKDSSTPGYCWYNNDESSFKATYGALYNWYAVSTGKLCPTGWHVPTETEWTSFTDALGGMQSTLYKIMETGTGHWVGPNTEATNITGFTAVPGGTRSFTGEFKNMGVIIQLWSSSTWADLWGYTGDGTITGTGTANATDGLSLRCIKD